jgi:hypothetical protein
MFHVKPQGLDVSRETICAGIRHGAGIGGTAQACPREGNSA